MVLIAKGVMKSYGAKEAPVLKDIHLKVNEGEFVSIMGSSGSGKSTLLYALSGMDKVTSGSVILDGEDLSSLPEKKLASLRLNKIGFIFQNIHLLKSLTIFDNIILSAYVAEKSSRTSINKRARELMDKTGILTLSNKFITEVSGGQLQRAAICRALINDPKIIFGDEPTGALHSKSALEIMEILGDINRRGTAILLVTHDYRVAAKADRILYMFDGKIVDEKILGKYEDEKTLKDREKLLNSWLYTMGY